MNQAGRILRSLSYYEVVAKNSTTIDIALWKNSSTARNLRQTNKITFLITDKESTTISKVPLRVAGRNTGYPITVSVSRYHGAAAGRPKSPTPRSQAALTYSRLRERAMTDYTVEVFNRLRGRAMKGKRILLPVVAILVLAGTEVRLLALGNSRQQVSLHVTMPVQRGNISQVVSSTGTLQAVVTVLVGSQVSGTIDKLFADFNSKGNKRPDYCTAQSGQIQSRSRSGARQSSRSPGERHES